MVKMMMVRTIVGTVVTSIYLMCLNRDTPTLPDAITVVSDSGDILSPK